MINTVNLRFIKKRVQECIQMFRAFKVVAKRFFHNYTA